MQNSISEKKTAPKYGKSFMNMFSLGKKYVKMKLYSEMQQKKCV